ncbi:hypothetical protein GCM10023149_43480 [Mucilaginibacter gynuensis]|uniref:6-bladed beta-propeller protein n=1 Tax=Mucilaginibacter gynuensis TaxID=1302236 RepID=A0ABP8H7I5_9SPHI
MFALSKNRILVFCYLTIFSLLTNRAYAQETIKVDTSNFSYLRLDPSNAIGGKVSDFFSEIEYIPLETIKESLFGSILRLEVLEDRFIILENSNHFILIFNSSGKYLSKVGTQKEYLTELSINRFTKQILFSNDRGKTLTVCDLNGTVLKKIKFEANADKTKTTSSQMIFLGNDESVGSNYYDNIEINSKYYKPFSKYLIHYAKSDRTVYAQALPYGKLQNNLDVINVGIGPLTLTDIDTASFYSKAYDYSIYQISPKTVKLLYKIIFPAYFSVPTNFATDTTLDGNRYQWFEKHPDAIFCVSNFFRAGDNITFKTTSWNSTKEDDLIYNTKSGTLSALRHIEQDSLSYHLPIFDETSAISNKNGVLASDKDNLYLSLSSLEMFKFYNLNLENKSLYPTKLLSYLKKGSKKDNAVIVRLKLKKSL